MLFALSWFCTSHVLAFDTSLDEPPACDLIDSHCDVRWGLVAETALGISREESDFNFRAALRFNFPLTDIFEVRTNFMLGGFPGFLPPEPGRSFSRFGAGLRVDLQLNMGSVYTLELGADVVLAFSGGLGGVHTSFLGFRIGPKREFLLNFPQHLWVNFSSMICLEQVLSVSYLFDL